MGNKMRVLFLSQGSEISDHPGFHDGFLRLQKEGVVTEYLNVPYFGFARKNGWDAFYQEVVRLSAQREFDVVYFQFFHQKGKPSPRGCIESLRRLPRPPVVIASAGDPFADSWMRPDYPEDFKEASRLADITFSTQMGRAADKMIAWGARNVVLAPNALCQVRFKAESVDLEKHKFDFDVVFVGNNNHTRLPNPGSKYWWAGKKRQRLVKALAKRFGSRFGLFGKGWDYPHAQGPVPFDKQQEVFRRGKVVVGANPYSYSDYYSSNRIFMEIASGIPTVELYTPRFEKVLRNGDHCYFASDVEEVVERCEYLLKEDVDGIYSKAAQAAKYITEKHTQYHRLKFELDTVQKFIQNSRHVDISFPFFLPEVNLVEESKFAVRERL